MKIFFLVLAVLIFMNSIVVAEVNNYKNAISLYQKGDYKAAIKYLKEYVEEKPDPYAYYLLGYASYKMKKHSEAMRYFGEAYTLDPGFTPQPFKK
jgi:TolA-binding protein